MHRSASLIWPQPEVLHPLTPRPKPLSPFCHRLTTTSRPIDWVTLGKNMRWLLLVPLLLESASGFVPLSPHCKGALRLSPSAESRGAQVARDLFGLFGGGVSKTKPSVELKELIVDCLRSGKELEGDDKARADSLIAE